MRPAVSSIIGFTVLFAGTIGCLLLAGHNPANYVFLPSVLAMLLIPVGCSTLAFGVQGPAIVARCFAAFWSSSSDLPKGATRVLSAVIGYVYGAGAFVLLACLVYTSGQLTDHGLSEGFRSGLTATIASTFYPVILAEVVLRPLKHRLSSGNLHVDGTGTESEKAASANPTGLTSQLGN